MTTYTFTLQIEVTDTAAVYEAAKARAVADRFDNYLDMIGPADDPDIAACVQMLLDPGQSPEGTQVMDSHVEAHPDADDLHAIYQDRLDDERLR